MPKSKESNKKIVDTGSDGTDSDASGRSKKSLSNAPLKKPSTKNVDVGVEKSSSKRKLKKKRRTIARFNALGFIKSDPYSKLRMTKTGKRSKCGPMTEKNSVVKSMGEYYDVCGYEKGVSPINLAIPRWGVARAHSLIIKYALNLQDSKKYPLSEGELKSIHMMRIPAYVLDYPNKITSDNKESESHQKLADKICETPLNLTSSAREIVNVANVFSVNTFLKKCTDYVVESGNATLNSQVATAIVSTQCRQGLGPSLASSFLDLSNELRKKDGDDNAEDVMIQSKDVQGRVDPCTYFDVCRLPTLQYVHDSLEMDIPN